jgi:hypothetical protein
VIIHETSAIAPKRACATTAATSAASIRASGAAARLRTAAATAARAIVPSGMGASASGRAKRTAIRRLTASHQP